VSVEIFMINVLQCTSTWPGRPPLARFLPFVNLTARLTFPRRPKIGACDCPPPLSHHSEKAGGLRRRATRSGLNAACRHATRPRGVRSTSPFNVKTPALPRRKPGAGSSAWISACAHTRQLKQIYEEFLSTNLVIAANSHELDAHHSG
jgi:hypothetical protein